MNNLETPEDKLGWMFDAFDEDGGGTVDGDEITNIVRMYKGKLNA